MKKLSIVLAVIILLPGLYAGKEPTKAYGGELKGLYSYEDFDRAEQCRTCHREIYNQWKQSMMGHAFTHKWDEIEYFDLVVQHAKKNPKFKPVADGCMGCHSPLAFMDGDLPPSRPEKDTMANQSVSCEVCHTISDYKEEKLFNFSYHSEPGEVKYGNRGGDNASYHKTSKTDTLSSAKFCANCHDEKSPWGVFVKSTYREWLNGPYSDEGIACQDCHISRSKGKRAVTDDTRHTDVRNHVFQGAHNESKTAGVVDVSIYPNDKTVTPGEETTFTVLLYNQKAGHKFPTGSVEDRLLHLHVEAVDSSGNTYHLPVDRKGFEGEKYTIASDTKAYQDFADMIDVPENFDGLQRDGVPIGDRIFRMPYFTEEGIMTICQWNTAKLGVDYRIGPRETKKETYTWKIPEDIASGKIKINASLKYQLLVEPVADFLDVPDEESRMRLIGKSVTRINTR